MFARLVMPEDKDAVLALAEMQVMETLPHLDFQRDVAEQTFENAVKHADPTIFVAEDRGEVVGYLMGMLEGYAFTSGVFVVQEVLYVKPGRRGSRAAVHLIKMFDEWAQIVGARESIMGISNKFQPGRTSRLFQRITGAEEVGVYLKKVRW